MIDDQHYKDKYEGVCECIWEDDAKVICDALNAAERFRWIPVSERLPEDRVRVLTCGEDPVDGGFMLIGYREPESKFGPAHWHLPCFAEFGPVSHWMPLPSPPTE
jgi:hypothetical protein